MSIRIGILGYGNLGRGVEMAVSQNDDIELVGIYTRRDPAKVKVASAAPVLPAAIFIVSGEMTTKRAWGQRGLVLWDG